MESSCFADGGLHPSEACHETAQDWPGEWATKEEEMLDLINQIRSAPQTCGDYGFKPPVSPLVMNPYLRCASRVHSYDMAVREYFDYASEGGPLGDNYVTRILTAGYT